MPSPHAHRLVFSIGATLAHSIAGDGGCNVAPQETAVSRETKWMGAAANYECSDPDRIEPDRRGVRATRRPETMPTPPAALRLRNRPASGAR